MKRRLTLPLSRGPSAPSAADANAIVQVKVWLLGITPMVWWRVLVPSGWVRRPIRAKVHGSVLHVMLCGGVGAHCTAFCQDDQHPMPVLHAM
jgi:hypothetical protein